MINRAFGILFIVGIFVSAFVTGCGGDDTNDNAKDAGDSGLLEDSAAGDAGGEEVGEEREDGATSCGNKKVEKEFGEECDDGNFNDNDGCTSLCELTCEQDADCDDGKVCNGKETCTSGHKCTAGNSLPDHTECGPSQSCIGSGAVCLFDACGDGWKQGSEECDDGNIYDDDGCTTKCKFSCVSTDKTRDCSDIGHAQCAAPQVCNNEKHKCEAAGSAAPDKVTACDLNGVAGDGWCISGQCVATKCGDGEPAGVEECDLGSQNGVAGSGCSINCKVQKCGNSKVEGTEECDDNNRANLDTCDKDCKSEFWYRYTGIHITKEPAPDWCVYSTKNTGDQETGGNQFGNAFPGDVRVQGMRDTFNIAQLISSMINAAVTSCDANVLNLVLDSEDPSFRTTDSSINVAVYDGVLMAGESASRCSNVDTRFAVRPRDIDPDPTNPVVSMIKVAQKTGLIQSLEPVDIQATIPGIGTIKLYDLLALIPLDMSTLSTPREPPAESKTVQVLRPEKLGFNNENPDPNNYLPAGRWCAAVGQESMSQVGVSKYPDESALALCCKPNGTGYNQCDTGDKPGVDCDTFLDVMKTGCMLCLDDVTKAVCGSACNSTPIEIIRAVDPDVDVNGDGTKDAYSVVIAVEGVRVRVTGVR
jgi:cysteine-rich repeat protein